MARPISKTTKFILALPRTMPVKEVLAKAKASGHKTSESNVHRVRRLHGRAKSPATPPVPAAAAKPARANQALKLKKSDFVRNVPPSVPAKEVVAKAKAAGLKLDVQYVYKIRSRSKPKVARKAAPRAVAAPPRLSSMPTGSSSGDLLRALGAEIGLGRAVDILHAERARVSSITRRLG
jgi:hypothetical protein